MMIYIDIDRRAVHYTQTKQLMYSAQDFQPQPEYYRSWKRIWQKIRQQNNRQDPLLDSMLEVFRQEQFLALFASLLYNQIIVSLPIFAYFIFQNILSNNYKTNINIILVFSVVTLKLIKPFLKLYAEQKFRQTGLYMHAIICQAISEKLLKVSLLSNKEITGGELIRIMQVDIEKIQKYLQAKTFVFSNFYSIIFSYGSIAYLFGFAGFLGSIVMVLLILIRFFMKTMADRYEEQVSVQTKNRVVQTVDIFNIIKLIKVAALQFFYLKKLIHLREVELNLLHRKYRFEIILLIAVISNIRIVTLIVILLWMAMGNQLNQNVIFTLSYILVNINYNIFFTYLTLFKDIQISLKAITHFLNTEEIDRTHITHQLQSTPTSIKVQNGKFYWQLGGGNDMIEQVKIRLTGIDFTIKKGELVSIVGKFGSGKSSIFNAILGEMKSEIGTKVTINGSIAYVSQKPWIINETVRNNILFGLPFNQKKYDEIVHYCCLRHDLDILKDGDNTLIGQRGCTLSGGQKARISLARAIYSQADIYLFDDILSSVDAHVGSFIFFETLSKYLKGKTILLITHSLSFVEHTDRVMIIDSCTLVDQGSFQQVKNHSIFKEIESSEKRSEESALSTGYKYKSENNVNYNQIAQGEQQQFIVFLRRCGKRSMIIISVILISGIIVNVIFGLWLKTWAVSSDPQEPHYTYIYCIIVVLNTIITVLLWGIITHLPILYNIYEDMVKRLLFTSLGYFETTPIAKIIHRLSNDLKKIDTIILTQFTTFCLFLIFVASLVLTVLFILIATKSYCLLALFIFYAGLIIYKYQQYVSTVKAYRKIDDQQKIAINNYFSEIISGQAIIRAFNKTAFKIDDFNRMENSYCSINMIVNNLDSLTQFLLSFSSTIILIIILITFFYVHSFNQFDPFLLYNLFTLQTQLERIHASLIDFLVKLKNLTRCQELTKIQPQAGYANFITQNSEQLLQNEPTFAKNDEFKMGKIQLRNLSIRYKQDSKDVIKKLSLSILGGQKIGIVGRTGSGKSTLFLALLRILEPHQGSIFIDGINTAQLTLTYLRRNISIILQEHFLFAGTVRDNIDPSHQYADLEIQKALSLCGLWDELSKREGLETVIVEGGENLSVGERQLLNIGRSLLNRKKIVLVDQATASIDIQTDKKIQEVFSTHFKDCTMLTIAHRINTIIKYDKILVLDGGQLCQFDSPSVLLGKDSILRGLYEQSSKERKE